MDNILVVAVHPDDETLGAGGTLLKHRQQGDRIHWLIATDLTKESGFSDERIAEREAEISVVTAAYGFDTVTRLGLKTARVDEYPVSEIIGGISQAVSAVKPDKIYLPFKSDVHSDHRIIFDAAYSCTKSFRYPFIKTIYMMEVLSETEFAPSLREESFIPNSYVDITPFFQKKLDIMSEYKNELGSHPFPRSSRNLEALALYRGASAGCEYAESFMMLKDIR